LVGDHTVGRLTKWLRALGLSVEEGDFSRAQDVPPGILFLTRKRALVSSPWVFFFPQDKVEEQIKYFFQQLPAFKRLRRPFSRCLRCNTLLEKKTKEEVFGQVPDYIYETHSVFYWCAKCQKIFWPGSHRKRMEACLRRWGLLP